MCGSTKVTLLVTSIVCMGMNGFNLSSRALGFRENLLEDKTAAYIPDVNDISKWVDGRKNSDGIIMGLAGVSLVFDCTLMAGTMQENGRLIHTAGIWASFDCIVDAVIGFLSANYTMPSFTEKKTYDVDPLRQNKTADEEEKPAKKEKSAEEEEPTEEEEATEKEEAADEEDSTDEEDPAEEEPAKEHLRRRRDVRKYSNQMQQVLKEEDEDEQKRTGRNTEERKLSLREPPPSAVKQFLHFAWVLLRFVIKLEILCCLFTYVTFLSERDEKVRLQGGKTAGSVGGTTTTSSQVQ